jgi:8-oxo-dGTP pyrophosphatase MutT (NUDIX family)
MSEMTPIPSATVTLVRDAAGGLEVLMMQRNFNSGFVPGAYVFPGGALDDEDSTAAAHALCAGLTDAQASRALGIAQGGLAYWAAAIRESFEEAGLLIAYEAQGRIVALDQPDVAERFRQHRHALNAGERGLLEILRAEKLMLAADQLVYFGHWITPVSAPRRYDTRFFAAVAPPAQEPLHDNLETISHVWVRPAEALDRHRNDDFKMRFPTVRTLEEFAAYASVDALMKAMRAKRDIAVVLPHIRRDGAHLLPGEPGYDELTAREQQGKWKI